MLWGRDVPAPFLFTWPVYLALNEHSLHTCYSYYCQLIPYILYILIFKCISFFFFHRTKSATDATNSPGCSTSTNRSSVSWGASRALVNCNRLSKCQADAPKKHYPSLASPSSKKNEQLREIESRTSNIRHWLFASRIRKLKLLLEKTDNNNRRERSGWFKKETTEENETLYKR